MTSTIRVAIIDDHVLLMEGMFIFLSRQKDVKVVNCSRNGVEFFEQLSTDSFDFDVLVLDINMHKLDGLQILRSLKESNCPARIIVHSSMNDSIVIDQCLMLGASSFILKESFDSLYKEIIRLGNVDKID